jgi:hypothetical protein
VSVLTNPNDVAEETLVARRLFGKHVSGHECICSDKRILTL